MRKKKKSSIDRHTSSSFISLIVGRRDIGFAGWPRLSTVEWRRGNVLGNAKIAADDGVGGGIFGLTTPNSLINADEGLRWSSVLGVDSITGAACTCCFSTSCTVSGNLHGECIGGNCEAAKAARHDVNE